MICHKSGRGCLANSTEKASSNQILGVPRRYRLKPRARVNKKGESPFLFTLALGFNLYRLGTPSIWFDEAFSVELARQPLPLLWHIIFGLEPNMELYYLLLHGWLAVTG